VRTSALISSLVSSLAWPAAAVALGLIFRTQIQAVFAGLAERMKHLTGIKAAGFAELSFGDILAQLAGRPRR
jgi:hypothetical protein